MSPLTAPLTRVLAWVSWLCLGGAVLVAATALFGHWAVNATPLGARDMGWAITFASLGALALRFLAAGAVMALPLAVLAW